MCMPCKEWDVVKKMDSYGKKEVIVLRSQEDTELHYESICDITKSSLTPTSFYLSISASRRHVCYYPFQTIFLGFDLLKSEGIFVFEIHSKRESYQLILQMDN